MGLWGPYKWPYKWVTGVKTLVRGVNSPYLQLIEVPPCDSYLALNVSIVWPKDDTVDGKNPVPLRMPEMLVLSQYQEVFGHPKWCRICFHQPYESICTVCICLYFPADTNSFCFALFTGFSGPITFNQSGQIRSRPHASFGTAKGSFLVSGNPFQGNLVWWNIIPLVFQNPPNTLWVGVWNP